MLDGRLTITEQIEYGQWISLAVHMEDIRWHHNRLLSERYASRSVYNSTVFGDTFNMHQEIRQLAVSRNECIHAQMKNANNFPVYSRLQVMHACQSV